jgi:hypothetical protein
MRFAGHEGRKAECGKEGIWECNDQSGAVAKALLTAHLHAYLGRNDDARATTLWNRCRKSRGACIGEPMSGCAHRRMPPTLKPTPFDARTVASSTFAKDHQLSADLVALAPLGEKCVTPPYRAAGR